MLAQAITVPTPAPTEPHQLPEPRQLLQTHPETPAEQMHQFDLPENTVGMARLNTRKRKRPATSAQGSSNPMSPAHILPQPAQCTHLIQPQPILPCYSIQQPRLIIPQQILPQPMVPHPIQIAQTRSMTPQFQVQFTQAPQMSAQQMPPIPPAP